MSSEGDKRERASEQGELCQAQRALGKGLLKQGLGCAES